MTDTHKLELAKTPTATLRNAAIIVTYIDKDGDQQSIKLAIEDHGSFDLEDTDGDHATIAHPTKQAALAIAEAFTRLAQELPEAPTDA